MKQAEYDKILRKCWDNDYKVIVVPTNTKNEYELKVKGQSLKNKDTDGWTFKVKLGKREKGLTVWERQKEAYINIYKRL